MIILTILVTIKINQFPIQADIFCCLQIWIIKNFTMYPRPHPRMAGKAAKVWRRQTTEAYLRWWWVPRCGPPGLPLPCVPRNKPGLCPPNVILSTSQPWSSWGWRVSVYISHFRRDPTPSWLKNGETSSSTAYRSSWVPVCKNVISAWRSFSSAHAINSEKNYVHNILCSSLCKKDIFQHSSIFVRSDATSRQRAPYWNWSINTSALWWNVKLLLMG